MSNDFIEIKIFLRKLFKDCIVLKNWAFTKILLSTLKTGVRDLNSVSRWTDKIILELSKLLGICLNEPITKILNTICNITSEFKPRFLVSLIYRNGFFNISFSQKLKSGKIKPVLSLCLGKNTTSIYQQNLSTTIRLQKSQT